MRKLLTAAALFFTFSFTGHAQTANWFVSVSTGAAWGGPKGSIKKAMDKNGLGQGSAFNFLGWGGVTEYPITNTGLPVLLKVGKKLKANKSLYVMAGLANGGEVRGFKNEGYGDFVGLFSFSLGTHVNVRYKVYQLSAGYAHTVANSNVKLGYGPSLYAFSYHYLQDAKKGSRHAMVPGLALTGRVPLGKEKRKIGLELVADINLAPAAKMKALTHTYTENNQSKTTVLLQETKVNMVQGMAGLALTFRKK